MSVKSTSTPRAMHHFYGGYVHQHLMENVESAMYKYRQRIANELRLLEIDPQELAGKVVFDIGTGFQSVVFAELGARHVYHIDINPKQVGWLQQHCAERDIKTVTSVCADVTKGLGELPGYDLAWVCGVYHHLNQPADFLLQLLSKAHTGSRIALRCYRSGTWSRWLVAHLRTLACYTDIDAVTCAFRTQYPLEDNRQFLSDMVDDLFVPVWGSFLPAQFAADAQKLGASFVCHDTDPDICFDRLDENFRFRFDIGAGMKIPPSSHELTSAAGIDQLGLDIPGVQGETFSQVWGCFCNSMAQKTVQEVAWRIVALYRLSRSILLRDYFRLQDVAPANTAGPDLGGRRLEALMHILETYSNKEDLQR